MNRAWFRFSLRSLLLAVLLLASAGTLWWNWGPWVPVKTVEAVANYGTCRIRGGGKFVVLDLYMTASIYSHETQVYEVVQASDGTTDLKLWPVALGDDVDFSEDGKYVRVGDFLYRTDTREKNRLAFPGNQYSFDSESNWIRHGSDWLHLPDCTKHPLSSHIIAANDKWILADDGHGGSFIYPFKEEKPLHQWPVDARWAQFLPRDLLVIWNGEYLFFYELLTGTCLSKKSYGSLPAMSWDNGGNWIYMNEMRSGGMPEIWRLNPKLEYAYDFVFKGIYGLDYKGTTPRFSTDSFLISDPLSAIDAASGRVLWSNSATRGSYSSDNNLVVCNGQSSRTCIVLDAHTGKTIYKLPQIRWPALLGSDDLEVQFLKSPTAFLTQSGKYDSIQFSLWDLRRPYHWYGPVYLPEFWLCIFFAGALGWSIISNARQSKKQTTVELN